MVTLKVRYVIPTLWPTVNENEITATKPRSLGDFAKSIARL